MTIPSAILLVVVGVTAHPADQSVRLAQSAPPRAEMAEALRQIVTRVDPVPPPQAVAAQIGGVVVAEIVIRVNGTVESARILAGHEILHAAALDAVRKWTFKPFLRNGKPARVTALVDLKFPDPKREAEQLKSGQYATGRQQCEQELRERSARAVEICGSALRLAEDLYRTDLSQRFRIRQSYGVALVYAGRATEALAELERALQEWIGAAGEDDADAADHMALIAVVHRNLGNLAKADEYFGRAERSFEAAIVALPGFGDYPERFAAVLRLHAELKRTLRQEDAAKALDARAVETVRKAPPPLTQSMRIVAGHSCWCPNPPHFNEEEITARLKSIPATLKPWFVVAEGGSSGGKASAIVHESATASGKGWRAGQIGWVSWGTPEPPVVKDRWVYRPFGQMWIQVDVADIAVPRSRNDPAWPIDLMWQFKAPDLTPDETAALVRFVRGEGARTAAAGRQVANLTKEIQPWLVTSIRSVSPGVFEVALTNPESLRPQHVVLNRTAAGWTVRSIRVF